MFDIKLDCVTRKMKAKYGEESEKPQHVKLGPVEDTVPYRALLRDG
jgi:hypothetical protein